MSSRIAVALLAACALRLTVEACGPYFIFVEGFAGAAGPIDVTVTLAP